MKVKDFFQKYESDLVSTNKETYINSLTNLLTEFIRETGEMHETLGIKTDSAFISLILEQNKKWNRLCQLFMEKYGKSPIKKNFFIGYLANQIPELDNYLQTRQIMKKIMIEE